MTCMHCAMRVKKAIEALTGINSLNVEVGKAELSYDESQISRTDIEAAIIKAGYKIKILISLFSQFREFLLLFFAQRAQQVQDGQALPRLRQEYDPCFYRLREFRDSSYSCGRFLPL